MAREYASRGKPLNILLDVVFKDVFTSDSDDSRTALKSLLSACIHRKVSTVQIINNEITPPYLTGKTVRLDVHVIFNDGENADLEMQMEKESDDLTARASYYTAQLLAGQAKKGKDYEDLKRVYQIFFVNGVIFPHSTLVPRRYGMLEKTTHEELSNLMETVFYELPKLEDKVSALLEGKAGVENLSLEEKWCIFFKYHQDEGKAGLIKELSRGEEGIMQAEKVLDTVSRDYEEWAQALFRERNDMDYRSGMHSAERRGYKKAQEEYEARIEQQRQIAEQQRQAAEQRIAELEQRLREAGLEGGQNSSKGAISLT
ncbi:MAG: Rpn family recombination-promoting nuclease/putative transposase [Treponema sp.]|nr:Rpn family recombination-promoting nuclease/putative transposase [Treponema sp.]